MHNICVDKATLLKKRNVTPNASTRAIKILLGIIDTQEHDVTKLIHYTILNLNGTNNVSHKYMNLGA